MEEPTNADANGEPSGMAGFEGFPNEVLSVILELLDLDALLKCHDVCRSWRWYSLYEPYYLPHILEAYDQFTYGTRPLPPQLTPPQQTEQLILKFRTTVSALPVFKNCETLRDIGIQLNGLDKSWLSGSNTSFAQLNSAGVHDMSIISVAIDAKGGAIVTGDNGGVVAFWDVSTGKCRHKTKFPFFGPQWATPVHLVVEDDLLVIGTPVGGVVVAARNRSSGDPFIRVAEFWTNTRVTSMRMEGTICIVGEVGQVSFWDLTAFTQPPHGLSDNSPLVPCIMTIDTRSDSTPLEASPNYSMFYRDSLLFLGLAGSQVQQLAGHSRRGTSAQKHLWEDEFPFARLASGPSYMGRREWGHSLLCPIGPQGDVIVSWADSSIYRLGSTIEDDDITWEPPSECLVGATGKNTVGIHAVGDRIICRFTPYEIEMFDSEGRKFGNIHCRYGSIGCMAVDPAFIVVGTGEASLCVYYFAPGAQVAADGRQGPLPEFARRKSLLSPTLKKSNTYKRKYQEAMGAETENPTLSASGNGGPNGRASQLAKHMARTTDIPDALGVKAVIGISVPTP